MSNETKIEIAVWFTAFCAICFVLVCGYISLYWIDKWLLRRMENSRRIKNSQLDSAYSNGQFYVAPGLRARK